jgi:hypothetical protein
MLFFQKERSELAIFVEQPTSGGEKEKEFF